MIRTADILRIVLFALSWGLTNRGRGWSADPKAPAWEKFFSTYIVTRYSVAAWHGISVFWASVALGVPVSPLAVEIGAATGIFWLLAVFPGWGEYQDGAVATNKEIGWIDWLVMTKIISKLPAKYGVRADIVDGISMGFRGAYYLPIFIAAGLLTSSWWFALPAAFFWQAGLVYFILWHTHPQGDFVRIAEWVDDTIRGLLFFTALTLTFA